MANVRGPPIRSPPPRGSKTTKRPPAKSGERLDRGRGAGALPDVGGDALSAAGGDLPAERPQLVERRPKSQVHIHISTDAK
jgi:hypothetical protein